MSSFLPNNMITDYYKYTRGINILRTSSFLEFSKVQNFVMEKQIKIANIERILKTLIKKLI